MVHVQLQKVTNYFADQNHTDEVLHQFLMTEPSSTTKQLWGDKSLPQKSPLVTHNTYHQPQTGS